MTGQHILALMYCIQLWDHSWHGLSQWETTLRCNVLSHWLSPYPEWSLILYNQCLPHSSPEIMQLTSTWYSTQIGLSEVIVYLPGKTIVALLIYQYSMYMANKNHATVIYPMHNSASLRLFTLIYACVPHFQIWKEHKHLCSFQLRTCG